MGLPGGFDLEHKNNLLAVAVSENHDQINFLAVPNSDRLFLVFIRAGCFINLVAAMIPVSFLHEEYCLQRNLLSAQTRNIFQGQFLFEDAYFNLYHLAKKSRLWTIVQIG